MNNAMEKSVSSQLWVDTMLLEIRNYTEATAWRKNVLLNGDLICHSMDKFTNCYKQSKEMVSMSCTPNFKPKL